MRSTILQGHALSVLKSLPAESVDMVMTSPPYWGLRDYGHADQLGLESDFRDFVNNLCGIFDDVKRVLKPEGTCWVNIGDTYAGGAASGGRGISQLGGGKDTQRQSGGFAKRGVVEKSLVQIPSRFAVEMTDRGWILRNEIIWHKPNAMPQSVKDRFSVDFEKLFFFTKSKRYYFDQQFEDLSGGTLGDRRFDRKRWAEERPQRNYLAGQADRGGGLLKPYGDRRNKRSVWRIPTMPFPGAHFAVFPERLCETPILAGCPVAGTVLDPFMGSGTTGIVALRLARHFIGIELNPEYIKLAEKRLAPYVQQTQIAV